MSCPKPPNLPPALAIFPSLNPPQKTFLFHQITILILTYIAYASFHASRKPPTIVKSVLAAQNGSGWPPFDVPEGPHRLGELDLAFLSSYSIGMYFAGHVADRIDLRHFLSIGMVASGVLTVVFGLGFWLDVHKLAFFMAVQIVCGLVQSIGWPCVVAIVGNWFAKSNKGLIMGVWSSHASVGNIIGSVVASSVLEFGWGWAFLVPGLLVMLFGGVVFCFLVVNPEDLGFKEHLNEVEMSVDVEDNGGEKAENEEVGLLGSEKVVEGVDAIGFIEAWKLPGVVPFAFCLFFSKLVAYTFLYWLPFYIRHTAVAGVHLSHKTAGILSTIFDIGGVVGGVLAGHISDKIEARAVTSIAFLLLSIPALVAYRLYGSLTMFANILLMSVSGILVNGPYSLITTAVAADLSAQSLGNSRALATVTAIIDGTGSVGAALGPLLAGYISTRGWNNVFLMLIVSVFCASLFLIRVAKSEIKTKLSEGRWLWLSSFVH